MPRTTEFHPLGGVVDHDGELVGKRPVCPPNEKIPAIAIEALLVATLKHIVDRNDAVVHAKPHGRGDPTRIARGEEFARFPIPFGLAQKAARPGVHEFLAPMRSTRGMKVGARAEARVDETRLLQQLVSDLVRPVAIMLVKRSAIPGEAEQLEIVLHLVDIAPLGSRAVEVLDSKHDLPALAFSDKPSHQSGEDVARMHSPRRGRGESTDDLI